jgi:Tfp pilus assembly protein PilF
MGKNVRDYRTPVLALLGMGIIFGCATGEPKRKELNRTEKARLLVQVANGALREGDPTGALEALISAEAEDDRLPELHHSKALAYFTKHNLKAALDSASTAVALKRDYSDANNTLGRLLMEAGRYDEAETPLKAAANDAVYRDAFKAWTNLGILKYRLNQPIQSESFFDRAIQESPNQACIAYYYQGHIKLKENRFQEAIQSYDRATRKFCAGFGEAHLALGLAYRQSKKYDLARKKFVEVQKLYPNTKLAEQALNQLKYLP